MTDSSIQRVAVVGAGISGVVSAGHLLATGRDVTVFERSKASGGVWLYDKRVPIESQYPCTKPSDAGWPGKDERDTTERQNLLHAPPGPCYESLTNNVSTPLLRTKLNDWPEGTANYVKHHVLRDYIQDTSVKVGVDDVTIYGALVTRIYKDGSEWHVLWTSLEEDPNTGSLVEKQKSAIFDAVVVASGHYHTPLVPDIPGLAEAKAKWPTKVTHSKSFRNSEGFEGKNVLLIGGGVSSMDIAREISSVAQNVHQSTRNGAFDTPATMLPENASRIAEVSAFEITNPDAVPDHHLSLVAHLKSGETVHEIDRIVLCTGYQMVLPFFPQYTRDEVPVTEADDSVLITDGTQVHNLHRDIFYIPDPTLAFVGIPFYTATFTFFEFQAIAVAAVLSGVAQLPSTREQRAEYADRLKAKGHGRSFHSLKNEEEAYVKPLMEWVNSERTSHGLPWIEGHTTSWVEAKKAQNERLSLILQGRLRWENLTKGSAGVEVSA